MFLSAFMLESIFNSKLLLLDEIELCLSKFLKVSIGVYYLRLYYRRLYYLRLLLLA